jgi:peptidoglycan/xylan/chitin deacetylase (PgdA/CDA1 family)
MENKALFTTSWDDGDLLDTRMAELLSRHGFQGTFYMPLSNREGFQVLPAAEMRRLGQEFEIGSHTLDHCPLKTVDAAEARRQIVEGKTRLEQILGQRVSGFCYPWGQYSLKLQRMVAGAGFDFARTCANFHRTLPVDPFRMPTTIQFYPHEHLPARSVLGKARSMLVRNFTGRGEWRRTRDLFSVFQGKEDFMSRLQAMLDHVCLHGGVFHLWGHSRELEAFDGWRQLDSFLRYAAERIPAERRLSNREVLQHRAANGG